MRWSVRWAVPALVVAAAVVLVPAQTPASAGSTGLAARVDRALAKHGHRTVGVSVGVWDAESGERLAEHNVHTPRRTASVMKLATTLVALAVLGPSYELATEVRVAAPPRAGVVEGDLVVRGGGDPGFADHLSEGGAEAEIGRLADQVVTAGVRRVEGDLVLDSSAFAPPARHPDWGYENGSWEWWRAPVTALTINDACFDMDVHPGGSVGSLARLRVSPASELATFQNRLVTTASKRDHSIDFGRRASDGRIPARGKVWTGSTGYAVSIACVDPPALFGELFRRALVARGVEIEGASRVVRGVPTLPPKRRATESMQHVVARHGETVADVVAITNTRSHNLYAELLLRAIGAEIDGDGSFSGGAAVVRRTLGVEPGDVSFTQADGSGLSRANRASPAAIGRLLRGAYASEQRLSYMASLPRAGETGTLKKRFRAKHFRDRVVAKTGTLRDTSALAGYVRSDEGHVLVFVILCEGPVGRARALQEAVVTALLDG